MLFIFGRDCFCSIFIVWIYSFCFFSYNFTLGNSYNKYIYDCNLFLKFKVLIQEKRKQNWIYIEFKSFYFFSCSPEVHYILNNGIMTCIDKQFLLCFALASALIFTHART
jgi:hypothetical protein